VDVFGGDAVGEGGISGGDRLFGSGGNTKRVGVLGRGLDPVLQTVLQEELEEHAVELDSHTWHFSLTTTSSTVTLSLPFSISF